MVERQLEILRTVIHQMIGKYIAVIQDPLGTVIQMEVIIQSLIGTIQHYLPVIMIQIARCHLHGDRSKNDGSNTAGGIAIVERAALQIAFGAAQAKNDVLFVKSMCVLRHGDV